MSDPKQTGSPGNARAPGAGEPTGVGESGPITGDRREPLAALYERFDAIAKRRASGNSTSAHRAVVNRLEANRKLAEACGWTACELERQGGSGRLRLWGRPPLSGGGREVVPDSLGMVTPEVGADVEDAQSIDRTADGSHRPGPASLRAAGGTRVLGVDVSWGAEARWLNEGGR